MLMLTDRRPILLANARVVDPSRDFDGPGDVLIADGIIRETRRGIGVSIAVAIVGAVAIIWILFAYKPWNNQTASDSANSNAGAVMGTGSGGQARVAPTEPGQSAPRPGVITR